MSESKAKHPELRIYDRAKWQERKAAERARRAQVRAERAAKRLEFESRRKAGLPSRRPDPRTVAEADAARRAHAIRGTHASVIGKLMRPAAPRSVDGERDVGATKKRNIAKRARRAVGGHDAGRTR